MAFATATQVATRMGRDLTTAETAQAEAVIETVEGLIVDAVGMTLAAVTALDPFPATLEALCIEKAVAVIANPQGVESWTEALGAYSHTDRFATGGTIAGVFLTEAEQRRARRAVSAASFAALTFTTPYSGDDSTSDDPELPLS